MDVNEVVKAYTLLSSLKQNLPQAFEVGKEWVDDFNSLLDTVEKWTGQSLQEYRVLEGELRRQVVARNPMMGTTSYGKHLVIRRSRLLLKVDAVLAYFQLKMGSPERNPIGFRKPAER